MNDNVSIKPEPQYPTNHLAEVDIVLDHCRAFEQLELYLDARLEQLVDEWKHLAAPNAAAGAARSRKLA